MLEFVSRSCTPLLVLDAEMDRGTVPICRSASRTNSGPQIVLPGLEHSGTSKIKKYPYLTYHSCYGGRSTRMGRFGQ